MKMKNMHQTQQVKERPVKEQLYSATTHMSEGKPNSNSQKFTLVLYKQGGEVD